jgi:hypothetical protein
MQPVQRPEAGSSRHTPMQGEGISLIRRSSFQDRAHIAWVRQIEDERALRKRGRGANGRGLAWSSDFSGVLPGRAAAWQLDPRGWLDLRRKIRLIVPGCGVKGDGADGLPWSGSTHIYELMRGRASGRLSTP